MCSTINSISTIHLLKRPAKPYSASHESALDESRRLLYNLAVAKSGKPKARNLVVCSLLKKHFGKAALHKLVTASREFPATARLDLQTAIGEVLAEPLQSGKLVGIHAAHSFETVTFAHLSVEGDNAVLVAPLQHDEVDAGETLLARCLRNALWLCVDRQMPFAVFLSLVQKYGRPGGFHLEVAVPSGESALDEMLFSGGRLNARLLGFSHAPQA